MTFHMETKNIRELTLTGLRLHPNIGTEDVFLDTMAVSREWIGGEIQVNLNPMETSD